VAIAFDTNALSAFAEGDRELLRAIGNESELAVPVIVLGEYFFGIRQSRLRASYESWIKANLGFFIVLPVARETAERYSEIRHELKTAGKPIPGNDLWIAAIAREHRMPLVTRDKHFQGIRGLQVLIW
jgi:tRNA(fMet)-specific endonuclease VapC